MSVSALPKFSFKPAETPNISYTEILGVGSILEFKCKFVYIFGSTDNDNMSQRVQRSISRPDPRWGSPFMDYPFPELLLSTSYGHRPSPTVVSPRTGTYQLQLIGLSEATVHLPDVSQLSPARSNLLRGHVLCKSSPSSTQHRKCGEKPRVARPIDSLPIVSTLSFQ